MTAERLGGGSEDGLGQLVRFLEPRRQFDAAYRAALLVFLPARAGKISARHALDIDHLRLGHQHGAPAKVARVFLERLGIIFHARRDQVVLHHVLQEIKPEERELRKYAALLRNAGGQNVVVWSGLLEDTPHPLNVVARMPPVTLGVKVAEE